MIKKIILSAFLISVIGHVYSQTVIERIKELSSELESTDLNRDSLISLLESYKLQNLRDYLRVTGLPLISPEEVLIEHSAYFLVYDEKHEQAKWVAHIITPDIETGIVSRTNDFREDTMIKTGSSEEADYFLKEMLPDSTYKYDGFGYDRGHLAPSADFRWSEKALSESYYYSNMSPQVAELNREGWSELEDVLRKYVIENKCSLIVVTAGVLKENLKKIERGVNKVSIPEEFYKVVYDPQNNKGVGFIMPNRRIEYPVVSFTKSIDEIEQITNIDFFINLDEKTENEIEKQNDPLWWLSGKQKNDIPPLRDGLPKGCYNTIQAKEFVDVNDKVTICGTVVSIKKTKNGHVLLNLDKAFPDHIFTVTIWSSNNSNFSYDPAVEFSGKQICVKGTISRNRGIPSMDIKSEEAISILK
ncbi:MAG: DNA/RNA non-specific endonuclease [Bacteroidota bacterium]